MRFGDLTCPTCQLCPTGHETGPAPGTVRTRHSSFFFFFFFTFDNYLLPPDQADSVTVRIPNSSYKIRRSKKGRTFFYLFNDALNTFYLRLYALDTW